MPAVVLLPAPVASGAIKIGQLLADPLNANVDSFINELDSFPLRAPILESNFSETITPDDGGRFVERQSPLASADFVHVRADQMIHTTLRDPLSAFRYTSRRASSQVFLHKAALRRQALLFVTGIQKLTNPQFIYSGGPGSSSDKPQIRRQDSGVSLNEHESDLIYAVELRKVSCRVSSPDEPQGPSEVGYVYKHYRLEGEEDLQLAVGLGQSVTQAELRAFFSGSTDDSDYTEDSADSDEFDDDEDEGCMCCSSSISNAAYRRY